MLPGMQRTDHSGGEPDGMTLRSPLVVSIQRSGTCTAIATNRLGTYEYRALSQTRKLPLSCLCSSNDIENRLQGDLADGKDHRKEEHLKALITIHFAMFIGAHAGVICVQRFNANEERNLRISESLPVSISERSIFFGSTSIREKLNRIRRATPYTRLYRNHSCGVVIISEAIQYDAVQRRFVRELSRERVRDHWRSHGVAYRCT